MATKSMQRTIDLLGKLGISTFIVEKFNAYAGPYGRREDLMGFIDLLALRPDIGTVGVQACGQDWSPHVKKLETERRAMVDLWYGCGNKVWLIGWRKLKQRNKDGKVGKRTAWVPRIAHWTGETGLEEQDTDAFLASIKINS